VEALLARGIPERDACIVLDVDLPGIGGIELKRTLIAAKRDLPTVFITALPPVEVRKPLAALSPPDGALQAVQRGGPARGARAGAG
jgi:CheY-like chemotaxis protein